MRGRDQAAAARCEIACASGSVVGRDSELGLIGDALDRLAEGHGDIIAVGGEPGVGKTFLLDAACSLAEAHGFRVLRGRGVEGDREFAFSLLMDVLTDGGEPTEAMLAAIENSAAADGQIDRYRACRTVHRLLEEIADERPVVLALDDLQWADSASQHLVVRLLREGSGPLLCLLARRPAQSARALETAIARSAATGVTTQIELHPLHADHVEQMLAADFAPSVLRRLYRESGGNPFYARELAAALLAQRASDARPRLANIGPAGVPDPVRTEVGRELASLSSGARRLIEGAAIAGEQFEPELAACAAGIADLDVARLVDELRVAQLVRASDAAAAGHDRLTFRHPIVRSAVYESTGVGWRIAAHRRLAQAYGKRGVPVHVYAGHVAESARPGDESAVALLERAAAQALHRSPADAARWLTTALWLSRHGTDTRRRLRSLTQLASALGSVGDASGCRAPLGEALALAASQPPAVRAEVAVAMARVARFIPGCGDVRSMLKAALAEAGQTPWAATLALELAVDHWLAGEWNQAQALAGEARRTSRPVDAALAAALLARVAAEQGASIAPHLVEARELLETISDDELAARLQVLVHLGRIEGELGEHREAARHLERGLDIARATGQQLIVAPLHVALGFVHLALGSLQTAADHGSSAVEAAKGLGCERLHARSLALCCAADLRRGDLPASLKAGHAATLAAARAGDPGSVAIASCWLGQAMIESGDAATGRDRILTYCGGPELAGLDMELRPAVFGALAEAELSLGRTAEAGRWVSAAELVPARDVADVLRTRATFLLATGDTSASELATEAVARYAEAGRAMDAARAAALAGRALALRGETDGALECLQCAHEELDRYGARRYRDLAARELRALGRHVARRRSGQAEPARGDGALTPREHQVAELVALEHTNRQIAGALCLSERTVESHLSNVFTKLGVSSRAGLAALSGRDQQS